MVPGGERVEKRVGVSKNVERAECAGGKALITGKLSRLDFRRARSYVRPSSGLINSIIVIEPLKRRNVAEPGDRPPGRRTVDLDGAV